MSDPAVQSQVLATSAHPFPISAMHDPSQHRPTIVYSILFLPWCHPDIFTTPSIVLILFDIGIIIFQYEKCNFDTNLDNLFTLQLLYTKKILTFRPTINHSI
jgi:hypothetical protein